MYFVVLVKLQVFSDISVHLPYTSASSPVYPLPPPTTLLGAIAYPYLTSKGRPGEIIKKSSMGELGDLCSPAIDLVSIIPYATAGSNGFVNYRFLERIYQVPYLRKQYQQSEKQYWSIAQRGGVVFNNDELYVLYITRNEEIAKYAWGIVRIGRKESHVSVESVHIKKVSEAVDPNATDVLTSMYAPIKLFNYCENAYEIEMPTISYENMCRATKFLVERYYVPINDKMKCSVKKHHGIVLNIDEIYAVIPSEYLGGSPWSIDL